jgi:hypothetical protein
MNFISIAAVGGSGIALYRTIASDASFLAVSQTGAGKNCAAEISSVVDVSTQYQQCQLHGHDDENVSAQNQQQQLHGHGLGVDSAQKHQRRLHGHGVKDV